jgi:hypothetical protein
LSVLTATTNALNNSGAVVPLLHDNGAAPPDVEANTATVAPRSVAIAVTTSDADINAAPLATSTKARSFAIAAAFTSAFTAFAALLTAIALSAGAARRFGPTATVCSFEQYRFVSWWY